MNNKYVDMAIKNFKNDGNRGIDWVYHMCMTEEDRENFDKDLLKINHPLVYQVGTNEYRFKIYVKEQINN